VRDTRRGWGTSEGHPEGVGHMREMRRSRTMQCVGHISLGLTCAHIHVWNGLTLGGPTHTAVLQYVSTFVLPFYMQARCSTLPQFSSPPPSCRLLRPWSGAMWFHCSTTTPQTWSTSCRRWAHCGAYYWWAWVRRRKRSSGTR